MFRILAVIAFIVAIVLFIVLAIGHPDNPFSIEAWGFVSMCAGLLCLALEGIVPVGPVRRAP